MQTELLMLNILQLLKYQFKNGDLNYPRQLRLQQWDGIEKDNKQNKVKAKTIIYSYNITRIS